MFSWLAIHLEHPRICCLDSFPMMSFWFLELYLQEDIKITLHMLQIYFIHPWRQSFDIPGLAQCLDTLNSGEAAQEGHTKLRDDRVWDQNTAEFYLQVHWEKELLQSNLGWERFEHVWTISFGACLLEVPVYDFVSSRRSATAVRNVAPADVAPRCRGWRAMSVYDCSPVSYDVDITWGFTSSVSDFGHLYVATIPFALYEVILEGILVLHLPETLGSALVKWIGVGLWRLFPLSKKIMGVSGVDLDVSHGMSHMSMSLKCFFQDVEAMSHEDLCWHGRRCAPCPSHPTRHRWAWLGHIGTVKNYGTKILFIRILWDIDETTLSSRLRFTSIHFQWVTIVSGGRDVETVIRQYTRFVKPSFEKYILPSRNNADSRPKTIKDVWCLSRGCSEPFAEPLQLKHLNRSATFELQPIFQYQRGRM